MKAAPAPAQLPENSCQKIGESCACTASGNSCQKIGESCICTTSRNSCQKIDKSCACTASRKQLTQSRVELRLHSFQFDFAPCSFFYIFVAELILQSTTAAQTHALHSDFILPLSTFTLHASPFTIHVSSFTFHPPLLPISEITPWEQSPYVVFTDLAFLKGVGGRGVSL